MNGAGVRGKLIPGGVTVIVTVLDDPNLDRALSSLLGQTRAPNEILVADGGASPVIRSISERYRARDPRFRRIEAPGTITDSRNLALAEIRTEFVAFLDTDEVAPDRWLERLLAPFSDPTVGFTGGPTPGLPGSVRTITARFYDGYLRWFYDRVARTRPHALPMGNSAWRMEVFRRLGLLDASLSRVGNEDQEMAHRALHASWIGLYVPEAEVGHDYSTITLGSLLKKARTYSRGGYVVWRRIGATYEATPGRELPYIAFPILWVVGALLLLLPGTRLVGWGLIAAGALLFAGLALYLTIQGLALDREYPGLRFRILEIPRRWATMWGAYLGVRILPRLPPPTIPRLPDPGGPEPPGKP